jgi:4-carboxymuconolactone decarboxylase
MARIPDIDESRLDPEQSKIYAQVASGPRGTVVGPLRVWLRNAGLADKAQALGAYCRYGTSLTPRLSELAILVVGAHWQSGFEWAVHAPIAVKAGIGDDIVEAIRTGNSPEIADAEERAVFSVASELVQNKVVSETTYREAERILGLTRLIDLIGVLGYYTLISMTINVFEIDLPEGASDPFGGAAGRR